MTRNYEYLFVGYSTAAEQLDLKLNLSFIGAVLQVGVFFDGLFSGMDLGCGELRNYGAVGFHSFVFILFPLFESLKLFLKISQECCCFVFLLYGLLVPSLYTH